MRHTSFCVVQIVVSNWRPGEFSHVCTLIAIREFVPIEAIKDANQDIAVNKGQFSHLWSHYRVEVVVVTEYYFVQDNARKCNGL